MHTALRALGWTPFFQQQLSAEDLAQLTPARVARMHRASLTLWLAGGELDWPLINLTPDAGLPVVGDWVLIDPGREKIVRVLERATFLERRAAGHRLEAQPIVANLDTLMIVTSCNQDFNLRRIERYLVLAREGGVDPVVLLTKKDLHPDPESLVQAVRALDGQVPVLLVNLLCAEDLAMLGPWRVEGRTLGLMGSSGVGKSTLTNALCETGQATQAVRAQDAKGRHTTIARSLHRMRDGGLLIDTPGMRELQLLVSDEAIDDAFEDVRALAQTCRFADCTHQQEPGCAVQAAVADGRLAADRLASYLKLQREHEATLQSLEEKRRRTRSRGKLYRSAQRHKQDRRR
jgi:ribosome biogenesis GTPase